MLVDALSMRMTSSCEVRQCDGDDRRKNQNEAQAGEYHRRDSEEARTLALGRLAAVWHFMLPWENSHTAS